MSELIVWERARAAIEQARSIDEIKDIRDKAEALRLYAKQAGESLETQNAIAEIKLRAERRAGEIIQEMEKAKPSGSNQYEDASHDASDPPTLADVGINYTQSSRWQKIADIPEDTFERHIAETKAIGDELTQAGLLRVANSTNATKNILSSEGDEWYTPSRYIEAARLVMGSIDVDPASSEIANRTVKAARYYSVIENGLTEEWKGNVWLNPPYTGGAGGDFVAKLISDYKASSIIQAIVLLNSHATETKWFAPLWDHLLCFTDHRINFLSPSSQTGTGSTHGSVFVYLGSRIQEFAKVFNEFGYVVARVQ